MTDQRRIAYVTALHELDLTEREHKLLSLLHGRMIETVGNCATPVTEQVIFAFNDSLKVGLPRRQALGDIIKYTKSLMLFGDAGSASCVPRHTVSVIKAFFDEAKAAIQHKEAPHPAGTVIGEASTPELVLA